jgi:hypothetical protein
MSVMMTTWTLHLKAGMLFEKYEGHDYSVRRGEGLSNGIIRT